MRQAIAALAFGFGALPAAAEELPTLADALSALVGTEVTATGHIGRGLDIMDKEAISFALPDRTTFPVVFDAGRNARRALEGCQFKMFGGTPCPATISAEIEMDGSRVRLIVFALDEIGPPEKF